VPHLKNTISKKQKKTLLFFINTGRFAGVLCAPMFLLLYIYLFKAELINELARALWDFLHIEKQLPASAVFALIEICAYWAITAISILSAVGVFVFFALLSWAYSGYQGFGTADVKNWNRLDDRFMQQIKANQKLRAIWSAGVFFCVFGAGLMYVAKTAFSAGEFFIGLACVLVGSMILSLKWHTLGDEYRK